MIPRRYTLQGMDIDTWSSIDVNALSEDKRKVFQARHQAIVLYAGGELLHKIHAQTGISGRQLYHLIQRCLSVDDDGRIFGLRGLLKHQRIGSYMRTAALAPGCSVTGQGFVGAFSALLERYPALMQWLHKQIDEHAVVLNQISTDEGLKTRLSGIVALQESFLRQCRRAGITAMEYPLNTDRMGIRSLSAYVKSEILKNFGAAARAAGAHHLKGLPTSLASATAIVRPFQSVEFDGHRLDLRLKIVIRDPLGYEQELEIERIWLLVILDVCTRAVLGYHLVIAREYSRYDVIKTIEQALTPHQPRSFTLQGVGYGGAGGFPSGKLPELGYAIWQRIKLDNAKANLANETIAALCEFIGCAVDAGPPYHPDDRPYIERFFGTIANAVSSRLPGYTGSGPDDVRRALSSAKGDLRLFLSLAELEELMEASLATYNATPHSGLNGRTPLEAMTYHVRGKAAMISWLPEAKRRTLCLMQEARRCPVRGYLQQGTRPHINLFQVRYTSAVLASSGSLLGSHLRVYYNSDDLRTVRAFLADGSELGILKAQGAWGEVSHDITLRREIMKKRGNKRLKVTIDHVFIDDFIADKKIKAKRSRRAASDLERTMRILAKAPTSATPPGPPCEHGSAPIKTEALCNLGEATTTTPTIPTDINKKIVPIPLTIGSGYGPSI
ncbi:transposase [Glaciimonas sp. GNP009]